MRIQGGQTSARLRELSRTVLSTLSFGYFLASESHALMNSEAERLDTAVRESPVMQAREFTMEIVGQIDE